MELHGSAVNSEVLFYTERKLKHMEKIHVRLTFIEDVLGTANADKKVHSEFIASKAPDAPSREEEVAALGAEEVEHKEMTIFPRMEDGETPMFWDYQIKGFFKDTCSALSRCKGQDYSRESCGIKAFKKIIDGCVFVFPRMIQIHMAGPMGSCQRPLRASTAMGDRTALANSETVQTGSWIEFTVECLDDKNAAAVREWLNYGRYRGMGQWRNSGKGRFTWEELQEDK